MMVDMHSHACMYKLMDHFGGLEHRQQYCWRLQQNDSRNYGRKYRRIDSKCCLQGKRVDLYHGDIDGRKLAAEG